MIISFFCFPQLSVAAVEKTWITGVDEEGNKIYLDDNRRPALYTQSFGDCQGDSLINVTRFDAAYYKDNMTILFHLAGNTALTDEGLMRASQTEPTLPYLLITVNSLHWGLCLRRTSV